MRFVIDSSAGGPLPQEVMRRIVEAADSWRGQPQAFVVYHDSSPWEVVSVHATEGAARTAADAEANLSYFGPVTPRPAASAFMQVYKPVGCRLAALPRPVSAVVLFDSSNHEVARFAVNLDRRLPNPQTDLEALFLTTSGIDKFLIPYLTRVFGVDYAAARRRDWITE